MGDFLSYQFCQFFPLFFTKTTTPLQIFQFCHKQIVVKNLFYFSSSNFKLTFFYRICIGAHYKILASVVLPNSESSHHHLDSAIVQPFKMKHVLTNFVANSFFTNVENNQKLERLPGLSDCNVLG